jgi:endonuclease G
MKYLVLLLTLLAAGSCDVLNAEQLTIDKGIYTVKYDTSLEQPLEVSYLVTNRPKNADRGSMNFKKEPGVHTSDNKDYVNNIWDKGHMAPAAHFSDSVENLRITFSFLNSALQHEKLNRGAWRFLEADVRTLAKTKGDLQVTNYILFSPNSQVLPTGATVPDGFIKEIKAVDKSFEECYFFTNEAPDMSWKDYKVECE